VNSESIFNFTPRNYFLMLFVYSDGMVPDIEVILIYIIMA